MKRFACLTLCLIATLTGCANRGKKPAGPPTTAPAVLAATDPALFALDQIEPRPLLPSTRPTTRPAAAPLDALQLYAQALAAEERTRAIGLLQEALKKDPHSFEAHYLLGRLHRGAGTGNEAAIEAFERAAAIDPDHLVLQSELGRAYLSRGNVAKAIEHLRLALQTAGYARGGEEAALVNLYLARALQQRGYDLAAVEQYETLLRRMQGRLFIRGSAELFHLLHRPASLHLQAGELLEKHKQFGAALEHYERAIAGEPNNFQYQAHRVYALLGLDRAAEARTLAATLVGEHRASAESIKLLKDVCQRIGREEAAAEELQRLLDKQPDDQPIAFALTELLVAQGRHQQAQELLGRLLERSGYDLSVLNRLYGLLVQNRQTADAAKLIIDVLAQRPDLLDHLEPLWTKLTRITATPRLRLPMLEQMEVSPASAASKSFWLSRMARTAGRSGAVREHLRRAIEEQTFPPAYRAMMSLILADDPNDAAKLEAAEQLIAQAAKQNKPALAAELRGLLALRQKKGPEAVAALEEAVRLGHNLPEVHFAMVIANLMQKRDAEADQILWKIASDWPTFDQAWSMLFHRALEFGGEDGARKAVHLLHRWIETNPASIQGRLLQATVYGQSGREDVAGSILLRLFEEEPDDPAVVEGLAQFHKRADRMEDLYRLLEKARQDRPGNYVVVRALVEHYLHSKRAADALRILDQTRVAVKDDVDQLYFIAHLYEQVGQPETTEHVLHDVLRIDPSNVPASNDLGYMWADQGKNLAQAESMIRHALDADPGNHAYLDSLGWVLYKRGKFSEAHRHLNEATIATEAPDPVVLDHLGDVLYRLNQPAEALKAWQRSLEGVAEASREDLVKLRLQLQQKIRQHETGEPVNVAPLGPDAPGGVQTRDKETRDTRRGDKGAQTRDEETRDREETGS